MRDGQYRLLWTGVSDSKKMKAVSGDKVFRIGCHLVYTWLLPWCDDDGRMPGEPLKILANVIPNEDFSVKDIEKMLTELDRVALIKWYEVDGERFIQILDWDKYQRIRKDRYHSSIYPSWKPLDNQPSTNTPQKCDRILSLSLTPTPTPSLNNNQHFEEFWNIYPARNGKKLYKQDAQEFFLKLEPEVIQTIIEATKNYAVSELAQKGIGIKDPIRFLRKEVWKEWIEPEKPTGVLSGLQEYADEIMEGEDELQRKGICGSDCEIGDGLQGTGVKGQG
jgi:hypothetical protein